MKTGRTIRELAAEIERQYNAKTDYLASTDAVEVTPGEGNISLNLDGKQFEVQRHAHGQIAEHTGIPRKYYDRMLKEEPGLLATNIDRWFKKYPAVRLTRMLDQGCRAFLSDSYRPLDNHDFAKAILPVMLKRQLNIMSCEITDSRLYIKAVDEQLYRDVPIGYKMGDGSHRLFDTCAPVVIASNSEIGCGRLTLETGVYTKACTNMALFADGGMRKTHLGSRHKISEHVENIDHLLSEKTKRKSDEAMWMQIRDVVEAAFNSDRIGERLEKLQHAATNRITGKVEKVMQLAADRFSLSDTESESVLQYLIEGGSLTQYGLHAAVTRASQDAKDYDRATEMEYLGGKIIELPQTEWALMAEAA
jgi:hypothetical protein